MTQAIFLPALSGLVIQLLGLLEVARLEPARRPNFGDWIYWLPYVIAPVVGGFAGFITFSDPSQNYSLILQAQVGASAPLLLKGFAAALPRIG